MDRISYAGDSVVTGTEIAHALLAYAQALAMNQASATVEIPVRMTDGTDGHASILIGPASQLISQSADDADGPEPIDEDLVNRLTLLTRRLQIPHPVPADTDEPATYDDLGFDVP